MAVLKRENGKLIDEHGRIIQSGAYNSFSSDIEGQMVLGEMADKSTDVFIEPEEHYDLLEQDGTPVKDELILSDDEVSSKTILNLLDEKPKEVLNFLLSKQSNAHPLKKGGTSIAYKCEALILATRLNLNDHENLLFDVILATVGSYPDNDAYTVYISDFEPYLPYKERRYIEEIFAEAKESLETKVMRIQVPNTDITLTFHLVGSTAFKSSKNIDATDKSAFFSFKLDPIVKALIISSGYTHGAHYKIEWSSKLKKYAKKLFFWLEDLKNYKAYPDAKPGVVYMSIEQVRDLLGIPSSYQDCDIKAKVLDPSIKKINAVEGIDIYTKCTVKNAPGSKKTIGYLFEIQSIFNLKNEDKPALEEKEENIYQIETGILEAYKFSPSAIKNILKIYKEKKRDLPFLTQAITLVENMAVKKEVASREKYLCAVIENGIVASNNALISEKKTENKYGMQRKYSEKDYNEIEQMMLNKPTQ